MPTGKQDVTLTIAIGESVSDRLLIPEGTTGVVIHMPAAWTAANLTFQGSDDDSTYRNVYTDSGQEVTVTAAASRAIVADLHLPSLTSFQYLKFRSGTAAVAVAQAASRAIIVSMKRGK